MFLPGGFVEGDDVGVIFAADMCYDQIIYDNRARCNAPCGHLNSVLGVEILAPQDVSRCGVEAKKMAHSAERIGSVFVDGNRSAWAVSEHDFLIFAFIVIRPDFVAGHGIKAVNTLNLGWGCYTVGYVNPAASDGWPAVAVGNLGAPPDIELWSIEFLDNALFGPDAVPGGTSPLGPIRAKGWNG